MKTGFVKAYINTPVSKAFKYHGINSNCNIQPDPGIFDEYPISPPLGPTQYILFYRLEMIGFESSSQDYNTAHDAVAAYQVRYDIGQRYISSNKYYYVKRLFVIFDTSIIPDKAVIGRARMKFHPVAFPRDIEFDLVIRNGMPVYPHYHIDYGDFWYGHYAGNGGSINTGSGNTSTWELNENGLTWINKTGLTKFAMISSRDIDKIKPTGIEFTTYNPLWDKNTLEVWYRTPI